MTDTSNPKADAKVTEDDPEETWISYRSGTSEPDKNGNVFPVFSRVTTAAFRELERKDQV